jgi:hypothetical protein
MIETKIGHHKMLELLVPAIDQEVRVRLNAEN